MAAPIILEEYEEQWVNKLHAWICEQPNGMWYSELQRKYESVFGKRLHIQRADFLMFLIGTPERFQLFVHQKGDFKIFDAAVDVQPQQQITEADRTFPSDVMQLNERIERATLSVPFVSVKICEVYDLSKFWFFTVDDEKRLNAMMDAMQAFYAANGSAYQLPTYQLEVDLLCVAIYDRQYHRAVIVNVAADNDDEVMVRYIDYATVKLVAHEDVFYLHRSFAAEKAFAMRGCLAYVQPVGLNMPWQEDATLAFWRWLTDDQMTTVARVRPVDSSRVPSQKGATIHYVTLGKQRPVVHYEWLHKHLLQANLAVYNDCAQDAQLSTPTFRDSGVLMHLKPTFDELEVGSALSRRLVRLAQEYNEPLENIYRRYLPSPT